MATHERGVLKNAVLAAISLNRGAGRCAGCGDWTVINLDTRKCEVCTTEEPKGDADARLPDLR